MKNQDKIKETDSEEAFDEFAEKARLNHKVSFHNFRYYFITELIRKGWSHNQVAKLTGHKKVETIGIYGHIVASDLRDKALEVINDL